MLVEEEIRDLLKQYEFPGDEIPVIDENMAMKNALIEMTSKKLGIVIIVNSSMEICGIITDGDLRRIIEKHGNFLEKKA